MTNYKEKLKNITTFIFDYDGVLTDGSVFTLPDGDGVRIANVKDGYALNLALRNGYRVVIISGGKSESMVNRLSALKIEDIFLGVSYKLEVFESYCDSYDLSPDEIIYMGDDIPDYEVMQRVGLACCPSDAAEEIRQISHYISRYKGGSGCVRDIIEQVMRIQGKWMNDSAFHW
ncbi:MAG: HAD hydrolase family protein [Bacteroidales bacterium]|nr:HAD hydrolase family protein [Bacteroidales bacterium]MDD2322819.1 HAD hydrolase family protein [Bacteroidales bacterium]MDD3011372.1 HAD hydrolase family protein [Bacteroidales bacterium]MDD3960536.1 HAD hydrolase family protein [Bacteroidales bacterium]MDY0284510.1 HAD hydrolase family protein [Bacteroidales bacterium]